MCIWSNHRFPIWYTSIGTKIGWIIFIWFWVNIGELIMVIIVIILGLEEYLRESHMLHWKKQCFPVDFPLNQSNVLGFNVYWMRYLYVLVWSYMVLGQIWVVNDVNTRNRLTFVVPNVFNFNSKAYWNDSRYGITIKHMLWSQHIRHTHNTHTCVCVSGNWLPAPQDMSDFVPFVLGGRWWWFTRFEVL